MLTLNRDILEEIVPHFNVWNNRFCESEAVEALSKFMRSGKEPYEAALRYFSHADTVIIDYVKIRIVVKRHILGASDGNNLYQIPYDFTFLDDILGVLEKSNTKLEIEDYPVSGAGKKALARLTQKHLKFVSFDSGENLPADYYKFFKNECNFDDSRLILCCVKKPTLSEFFELTSKHRSITTHLAKFFQKMASNKCIFPAVESISFDPCFCEDDFGDCPFIFTTDAIHDFLSLLIESMPNLNKIVADFCARPEQPIFTWKRVYKQMKKFCPEIFQHIPAKVKGALNFYVHSYQTSLKKILEILPKINPGVDIDNVNKQLVKKFEIHDGFTFEFVLQLDDEESEDEFEDTEDEIEAAFNEEYFFYEDEEESGSDEGSYYFNSEEDDGANVEEES